MKLPFIIAATSILTGCGGGTSLVTDRPQLSSSEYYVNVRDHQSSGKVYLGNEVDDDHKMKSFVALVNNEENLHYLYLDESTSAVHLKSDQFYNQIPTGEFRKLIVLDGLTEIETILYIDTKTEQELWLGSTELNGRSNIIADGAKLSSIPSGSYRYEGGVILQKQNSFSTETGAFTMVADFDNGKASLSGSTSTYNISSNEIEIITTTGQFGSKDVLIHNPYTIMMKNNWVGELDGTFTGQAAAGVIGVFSSTDGQVFGGLAGTQD